tara:strand:- start:202 stop:426 length:225 start_codon:yes stop_codon:yes gene_type:complete
MRELKTIIKIFFKKNFFNAKIYPIITAKKEDTIKAVKLTFKDKIMISNNNGSKVRINFMELKNISRKFINKLLI